MLGICVAASDPVGSFSDYEKIIVSQHPFPFYNGDYKFKDLWNN